MDQWFETLEPPGANAYYQDVDDQGGALPLHVVPNRKDSIRYDVSRYAVSKRDKQGRYASFDAMHQRLFSNRLKRPSVETEDASLCEEKLMSPSSQSSRGNEKSSESHRRERARPTVALSEDVRDIGAPNQRVVTSTEQAEIPPEGGRHFANAGDLKYAKWSTGNASSVAPTDSWVDDTGTAPVAIQPVVPSNFSPADNMGHFPERRSIEPTLEVAKPDLERGAK